MRKTNSLMESGSEISFAEENRTVTNCKSWDQPQTTKSIGQSPELECAEHGRVAAQPGESKGK